MRIAVDATPLISQPTGVGTFVAGLISSLSEFDNPSAAPSKITGTNDTIEVVEYALSSPRDIKKRARRPRLAGAGSASTGLSGAGSASTDPSGAGSASTGPSGAGSASTGLPGTERHMFWLPPSLAPWVWRYAKRPIERKLGPLDVVHGTSFMVPPTSSALSVVTVHDLTYLIRDEVPRRVTWWDHYVRFAIEAGAVIHAQSQYVADEIAQRYDTERIGVVRPALMPRDPADIADLVQAERQPEPPYILALGFSQPRKRLPLLVGAFEQVFQQLRQQGMDCQLKLIGPPGLDETALVERIKQLPSDVRNRVIRRGWVPADERDRLLAGASVLAFPSIYEGFGYPALEAMRFETPVVAAQAGALPEAVGPAALLVPPDDASALADALARVLTDEDLHADLVSRGKAHCVAHTPSHAAAEMLALYGLYS